MMNLWHGINGSWFRHKVLWMSCMSASILFGLNIHQVILFISIFWDQWLSELMVDLRHGINSSWLWYKMFGVSCMSASILLGLNIHQVILLISVLWNKRFSKLMMNLWHGINSSWFRHKVLWMSCMSASILLGLNIHQVILFVSVFWNKRFSKLMMNLWHGVNGSWLWNKMFWMSSVGATILLGLKIHKVIWFVSVFWNKRFSKLVMDLWHGVNSPWLWNEMFWMSSMSASILLSHGHIASFVSSKIGILADIALRKGKGGVSTRVFRNVSGSISRFVSSGIAW